MIELSLIAPGLLGPWPESDRRGFPLPAARGLEGILASALQEPWNGGFYDIVCALHGIDTEPGSDPPVAGLSRLADGGDGDGRWWLRLDLVHREVDQTGARLADPHALGITEEESARLWATLGPYFEDIGWRVEPLHWTRWYLSLDSDPRLQTRSLNDAVGERMDTPGGVSPDNRDWLARLTEIQMLLHDSPVNLERERRGQPAINALWLWGGGTLPNTVGAAATQVFCADSAIAGLAALSGEQYSKVLPEELAGLVQGLPDGATALVVLDEPAGALADGDPQRWSPLVEHLDRRWLRPALKGVRSGRIRRLRLWPCNGWVYQLSWHQAWLGAFRRHSLCRHL